MSGNLSAEPMVVSRLVFVDGNGTPLLNGKVFTYVPGTTTLKATWEDSGQVTANSNPIDLDGEGSAIIFASGDYRIVVQDQFGAQIFDGAAVGLAVEESTVSTIAELKALNVSGGGVPSSIIVAGYWAIADGGGGIFVSKPGDTSPDNGGTIIVDQAGNRWFRLMEGGDYSVRWFGAKGDGATDDTAPIRGTLTALVTAGGGNAVLVPGNYITSDTLLITSSHVGIIGLGREICIISCSKATGPIVEAQGAGNALLSYNTFRGFSINRTVAPTDASTVGLFLGFTVWTVVEEVTSSNNTNEFWNSGTANATYEKCTATRSVNTGDTSWVGFYLDGDNGNASFFTDDCNSILTGAIANVNTQSAGVLLNNGNIKDAVFANFQSANVRIGIEVDAGGSPEPVDIHFDNAVNDSYFFAGFFITSAGPVAAITISEGWNSPQATGATTYGVRVVNSRGVTITGGCQILGGANFGFNFGVSFEGAAGCELSGCILQNNLIHVGLGISGTGSVCELNIVGGNRFFSLAAQPAQIGINCVSASRNMLMGNTFDGDVSPAMGFGIVLDANSGFNNVTPQNFNPGIINGGTANQIIDNGTSNSTTLGVLT